MQTPIVDAGMATPSGMSSVGAPGQETPELIELRKRRIEQDMEGGETPNLYTILPEKKNDRMGAGMFLYRSNKIGKTQNEHLNIVC